MSASTPHLFRAAPSYDGYAWGCGCDGCAEKKRAYREQNRAEIAEKKRVELALAQGLSASQVMAQIGCSYETVQHVLKETA